MNLPQNKTTKTVKAINNCGSVEYINANGKNCTVIKNAEYFKPSDIFDCGQCFRFNKISDENYAGVAFSRYIRVYLKDKDIYIENAAKEDFESIWHSFFGLDRDYGEIMQSFKNHGKDGALKKAMSYCPGIRILHQDIFECLISFIISQNNNIPRIKKIVESLCSNFGDVIGDETYAFPNAEQILRDYGKLDIIKSGFRAKYIYDAARKVADGIIDLNAAANMSVQDGSEYLMNINGVGPKVASCVMLFGYNKLDAFPIDVWVKRILEKYYQPVSSPDEVYNIFGEYAGAAQQYLFHWERTRGADGNSV